MRTIILIHFKSKLLLNSGSLTRWRCKALWYTADNQTSAIRPLSKLRLLTLKWCHHLRLVWLYYALTKWLADEGEDFENRPLCGLDLSQSKKRLCSVKLWLLMTPEHQRKRSCGYVTRSGRYQVDVCKTVFFWAEKHIHFQNSMI